MGDALVGSVLASRYRVEARLGAGAMGTVYLARHVKVGRAFAIKLLHPRLVADPKLARRFDREAEIAGTLAHRNVVGVIDAGETADGLRYLVMEHADGPTLGDVISQFAPMSGPRVLRLVQQLCDGLQHAHEHGLIHRDFKPDNVIVELDDSGHELPRIVDFGISILREDAGPSGERERLTTEGLVLGTPQYMAPEHARGHVIDHRIDLFALGVICFEMLTGQMPFDGDGVDVARANIHCPTPPMGVRVPTLEIDPLLEAFTRKLLGKSPDDRPASARAARELLDLIEHDRDAAARALGLVAPRDDVAPTRPPPRAFAEPKWGLAPLDRPSPLSPGVPLAAPKRTSAGSKPPIRTAAATAPTLGVASSELRTLQSRRWLVLATLALLAAAIGLVVVLRARAVDSTAATPLAPPPIESPAIVQRDMQHDVQRDVPREAIADVPPPSPPHDARAPHARPAPASDTTDPTAEQVTELYAKVGRALANVDSIQQPDLLARYRYIRLHDAITTPETRRQAYRELQQLAKAATR